MKKTKKIIVLIFAAAMLFLIPVSAFASSSETVYLSVLVYNAPEQMSVTLTFPSGEHDDIALSRDDRLWETTFTTTFGKMPISWQTHLPDGTSIVIETAGESFELTLPKRASGSRNTVFTLDLENETVSAGAPGGRHVKYLLARVLLCVLSELLIVLAMGFRKLKTWLLFIAKTALVQVIVNFAILGSTTSLYGEFPFQTLLTLGLSEFFIFVITPFVFSCLVWEKHEGQTTAAVEITNGVTLIAAVASLMCLPM